MQECGRRREGHDVYLYFTITTTFRIGCKANGGTPVAEGKYTFPPLSLGFGIVVENLGVHAYLGQAALIKTPAILLTAASIVTVEARHAAAWMTLAGQDPTLGAFDGGLDMATVVAQVTPFFAK